MSALPYNSW